MEKSFLKAYLDHFYPLKSFPYKEFKWTMHPFIRNMRSKTTFLKKVVFLEEEE